MVKMKLAAATPRVWLADVRKNYQEAVGLLEKAAAHGAEMIVFPPHFLTGATCGVLAKQKLLAEAEQKALEDLKRLASDKGIELVSESCSLEGLEVICLAVPEMVTRYRKVKEQLALKSAQERLAYVYCPSGYGESTADGVYAGGSLIYCNGRLLAAGERFKRGSTIVFADIDTSVEPAETPVLKEDSAPRPHPFIPDDKLELAHRCDDILRIVSEGSSVQLSSVDGIQDGVHQGQIRRHRHLRRP